MKKNLLTLFLGVLIFAACSLSTDPDLVEPDISSVPYDDQVQPYTADSVNLYWKCKNHPLSITIYNADGTEIERITPPSSRIDTLSDSSFTVGFRGLKPRNSYKWQVIVEDKNNTVITGPMWDFQFLPGGETEGRLLKFLHQDVFLPHNVNVYFQVQDLYGVGDTTKIRKDFRITDEGTAPLDVEYIWDIQRINPPYYSKIVLLLDVSYSIKSSPEFIKMKDEAYKFVDNYLPSTLDQTKQIELWKFSDHTYQMVSLTPDKSQLLPVIQSLSDTVFSTDLYGSVIKATDEYENVITKDDVVQTLIVVFTDGSDTQGRKTLNQARLASIGKNVIYVNTDESNTYRYYLNELNTYPNYLSNDYKEILEFVNAFTYNTEIISKSIYGLFYNSPKRGNFVRDLSIILNAQAYMGPGSIIKTNYSSDGFY